MTPSLDNIALFVEVAKTGSFTRAAQALNMPTSTLSRRISEMERDIGVLLLKRSTRKVGLTEAGFVYFERCQRLVVEAQMAHEELLGLTQRPNGRLRISMPSSFAMMYMPLLMRDFSQQFPEIDCEYDLGIQAIDLLADPFDVVIRYGSQTDSGVISRQLGSARLGLYASSEYLARHGTPTTPAHLQEHKCLRSSGSNVDSVWELSSEDKTERVTVSGPLSVNNVAMLSRMATLGLGIVPMSDAKCPTLATADSLVRILPEWSFDPIPLLALFPSRLMPAKARVFIEFLMARLNTVL